MIDQNLRSQEENVAKVVGATLSEGFLSICIVLAIATTISLVLLSVKRPGFPELLVDKLRLHKGKL